MTPFVLNEAERQSALWIRLKAHLEQQLAIQRERNDNPNDDKQGERIRGRIAQLKDMLALDKPSTTQDP